MQYNDDTDYLRALSEDSLNTTEVADKLGITDRQARKRLNRLVDQGLVDREGKGFATWSLTEEGRDEINS